jgi:hypothetical protein
LFSRFKRSEPFWSRSPIRSMAYCKATNGSSPNGAYTFIVIKPQDLDWTPKGAFLWILRPKWGTTSEMNLNRRTQTHGDPSFVTGLFVECYSSFRDDCSEWKPVWHHSPPLLTNPNNRVRFACESIKRPVRPAKPFGK